MVTLTLPYRGKWSLLEAWHQLERVWQLACKSAKRLSFPAPVLKREWRAHREETSAALGWAAGKPVTAAPRAVVVREMTVGKKRKYNPHLHAICFDEASAATLLRAWAGVTARHYGVSAVMRAPQDSLACGWEKAAAYLATYASKGVHPELVPAGKRLVSAIGGVRLRLSRVGSNARAGVVRSHVGAIGGADAPLWWIPRQLIGFGAVASTGATALEVTPTASLRCRYHGHALARLTVERLVRRVDQRIAPRTLRDEPELSGAIWAVDDDPETPPGWLVQVGCAVDAAALRPPRDTQHNSPGHRWAPLGALARSIYRASLASGRAGGASVASAASGFSLHVRRERIARGVDPPSLNPELLHSRVPIFLSCLRLRRLLALVVDLASASGRRSLDLDRESLSCKILGHTLTRP